MLALVKTKAGFGAELKEVDIPKPGPGEVLLRVHRASICGSDIPIYSWTTWAAQRIKPPLIFGHEICGEIAECGRDAKRFKPGQIVAVESHIFCGKCASCGAGDRHICRSMAILGFDVDGGFAEYLKVPERVLWPIVKGVPYDYASLMEPFGNAVYATCVEPVEGKTVLIMGCGPQGLFAVSVAKAKGAALVVAVEQSKFRSELAKKLGADHIFSAASEKELLDQLLSLKQTKEGYDVCLEMSGSSMLAALSFKALRNGGRLSLFGLTAGKMGVDFAQDVIFRGMRIYGIIGRRLFETWQDAEALVVSGRVKLENVATHLFPLNDAAKAFELFLAKEKNCGKVLFNIH